MARKKNSLVQDVAEKLTEKGGLTPEKAEEIAKLSVPLIKKAIKAEATKKADEAEKLSALDHFAQSVVVGEDEDGAITAYSAPDVSLTHPGVHVALPCEVLPYTGAVGASLLQTIHGISTGSIYVVAAVKGELGIVAVKKLDNHYKVKLYPNFEFWELNFNRLQSFGAVAYGARPSYERMLISQDGFQHILNMLIEKSAGKTRTKDLTKRYQVAVIEAVTEILGEVNQAQEY